MSGHASYPGRQRGITLVIALIMLTLLTLLVITAYSLSTSNLRAVGNMQMRNEAVAAADAAIEQVVGSNFTETTGETPVSVNIDNDGEDTAEFEVTVRQPQCVRASQVMVNVASSVTLPPMLTSTEHWNTVWEIRAEAVDTRSGARVAMVKGVRVLLTTAEKDARCG